MSRPNFIIVGAAKAGTTSLYQYLNQHPDIYMPDFKEPHYFASDQAYSFSVVDDWQEYQALFAGKDQKVCGEASTGYLYFPGVAKRIKQELPDCKIIIMVRDPAEIAFSMWGHQVREGLEEMSFQAAVADELANGTRINNGVIYGFNYVRQARISDNIVEYLHAFGAENVLLCSMNDMRDNPSELVKNVFRFLGCSAEAAVDFSGRHNPSGKPASAFLHYVLNSTASWRKLMAAPLKLFLTQQQRHALWGRLRDNNIRRGTRHKLDDISRAMLEQSLSDEREALKRIQAHLKGI